MRTSLARDGHEPSTGGKAETDRTIKRGRERGSAQGTFSASRSSPRRESKRKVRTLAVAHLLESSLVAERVLARLDDEGETGGDGLGGLCRLGLLGGGHWWW